MIITEFKTVFAEESLYSVFDYATAETVFESDDYNEALKEYRKSLDNYDNLVLAQGNTVLEVEYGVVRFSGDSEISYISELTNSAKNLDPSLCSEALYLGTADNKVRFEIAGDIGSVDIEDAILYPVGSNSRLSVYRVEKGVLYHLFNSDADCDYYQYSLAIDLAPECLEEGIHYLSYDGHYFYEDFIELLDDTAKNIHDNAVNSDEPYYNYYQYLPFHTTSAYSYEELDSYLRRNLMISSPLTSFVNRNGDGATDNIKESQLFDHLDDFMTGEAVYGVNASLLLAISMQETSYGKSRDSFTRNNLFASAAFDSYDQIITSRYDSLENSVFTFIRRYVLNRFASLQRLNYRGGFLGNKASGMNGTYTGDPYWSEKVVSRYFQLDRTLGMKERGSEAILICKPGKLRVYPRMQHSKDYELLKNTYDYAFCLADYEMNFYKVRDDRYSSDGLFDFEDSYSYISSTSEKLILFPDSMHEQQFSVRVYDFGEGSLDGHDYLELQYPSDKDAVLSSPSREGYEFVGYQDEGGVRTAQYELIDHIDVSGTLKLTDDLFSFEKCQLRVVLENGRTLSKNLSSDNISLNGDGTATISYNGVTVQKDVEKIINKNDEIQRLYEEVVHAYLYENIYDTEKIDTLRHMVDLDTELSAAQIRALDHIVFAENDYYPDYYIEKNAFNAGFSGLSISLSHDDYRVKSNLYSDTYHIQIFDVTQEQFGLDELEKTFGFKKEAALRMMVRLNYMKAVFASDFVMQLELEGMDDHKIYSVYCLGKDGSITKCRTERSATTIQFIGDKEGTYVVYSRDSFNEFPFINALENFSYETNKPDSFRIEMEIGSFIFLSLVDAVVICLYYVIENRRVNKWNDFRRSLLQPVYAPGEKQKS